MAPKAQWTVKRVGSLLIPLLSFLPTLYYLNLPDFKAYGVAVYGGTFLAVTLSNLVYASTLFGRENVNQLLDALLLIRAGSPLTGITTVLFSLFTFFGLALGGTYGAASGPNMAVIFSILFYPLWTLSITGACYTFFLLRLGKKKNIIDRGEANSFLLFQMVPLADLVVTLLLARKWKRGTVATVCFFVQFILLILYGAFKYVKF